MVCTRACGCNWLRMLAYTRACTPRAPTHPACSRPQPLQSFKPSLQQPVRHLFAWRSSNAAALRRARAPTPCSMHTSGACVGAATRPCYGMIQSRTSSTRRRHMPRTTTVQTSVSKCAGKRMMVAFMHANSPVHRAHATVLPCVCRACCTGSSLRSFIRGGSHAPTTRVHHATICRLVQPTRPRSHPR